LLLAEQTVPLTLRPGSFMLIRAIREAIDNYAECEMDAGEISGAGRTVSDEDYETGQDGGG
jgi:hypothetical protein